LVAKSYFLSEKYDKCKELLLKLPKPYTTKILYERQSLLFKASYLMSSNNISDLENILKEYTSFRTTCSGKPLTKFHHDSMDEMMDVVKKGATCANNTKQINIKALKDEKKA
jgi:hypothetical protein